MASQNFKKYRLAANLNQREAARLLNVSPGSLSQWETGFCEPNIEVIASMANIYGCTTDELLGRESPKQKEPALDKPEDRLPPVEVELLSVWRAMTEEQRMFLMAAACRIINKAPRDPE